LQDVIVSFLICFRLGSESDDPKVMSKVESSEEEEEELTEEEKGNTSPLFLLYFWMLCALAASRSYT